MEACFLSITHRSGGPKGVLMQTMEKLMGTCPDGLYGDTERAADGRTGLYLKGGRLPDREGSGLTEVLDEL